MLYVSTRNDRDTFTAYHALTENRAPDGGHYVPFRMPVFDRQAVEEMGQAPQNQTAAEILNLLFQTQLSKWDVDFAAGRYPVRTADISRKTAVVELWHNLDWDYPRTARNLAAQLRGSQDTEAACGQWVEIVVRIALLFGAVGETLHRTGEERADIALASGDFSGVMAAWYARQWGLPIGNIVCCCNENNNLWELVYHGILRTDSVAVPTCTPSCDQVVAPHLERLIYACGGREETDRFIGCCREGRSYYPPEEVLCRMRQGLHVSVISQKRLLSTIPNAYATHGYVFGPYSALAYAGLMDYRAKTGESGLALIVSEQGALCQDGLVASAMGMGVQQLHKLLQ